MSEEYYFIGIGGAGMSVIAELLWQEGYRVSGSDRQDSAVLDRLRARGITAHASHDAHQVPPEAVVVVSSAIRETNPELAQARARGQQVLHRSEALALAARGKRFVAVAGAHGKTSTSALLTQALVACGADPSCALGGPILGLDSGALLGQGDIFVAEADESDGSFLNYRPTVALVTNIEADHLDHFGSIEAFEGIFFEFAQRIVPGGALICCAEDPGSARLAARARTELTELTVLTYGRAEYAPDLVLTDDWANASGSGGTVTVAAEPELRADLNLQVTGAHNVLNATGAWGAGLALGFEPTQFAEALGAFRGAGRRFETKGVVAGRRVIVDYAHHPTEIEAALKQARLVAGTGRVVVVFQPHLYSRTLNFADRFARILAEADRVVLADIYAAREDPMPGVSSQLVVDRLLQAGVDVEYRARATVNESALLGAELCAPGDLLLLVGAGDINQGADAVLDYWERV